VIVLSTLLGPKIGNVRGALSGFIVGDFQVIFSRVIYVPFLAAVARSV
jgi:hypothetical protein